MHEVYSRQCYLRWMCQPSLWAGFRVENHDAVQPSRRMDRLSTATGIPLMRSVILSSCLFTSPLLHSPTRLFPNSPRLYPPVCRSGSANKVHLILSEQVEHRSFALTSRVDHSTRVADRLCDISTRHHRPARPRVDPTTHAPHVDRAKHHKALVPSVYPPSSPPSSPA